ncbi:hypothetical protein VW29_17720 [Devosia limi DSM 17137]|uniref:Acyltransferase 3 domain-containing protein n=2 Tax=Devosia limi DSM 17137 TaxID=1121477 RepID=A0A0F5LB20_9HYPH|nr:hypothetical protein VW29_17720 [Devosia limi DSM 17137]
MTSQAMVLDKSSDTAEQVMLSHRNNFNLIRLVAAIQVLLVHGCNHFGVTGWYVTALKAVPGVPVFFFISGFLIYQAYERSSGSGLFGFYRNRFLRIFPGLWVCVILSTLAVAATGYFEISQPSTVQVVIWLAGQMTFAQFYNPDFMRAFGDGVLNGALWTITVELQFYIITPVLAFCLASRKWIFGVLLAVSVLTNQLAHHTLNPDSLATKLLYVTFAPWVYMFMTGMLVARYRQQAARILQVPFVLIVLAFLASMFLLGGYHVNAQNSINPISFLLICVMIFKLAFMSPGRLEGALRGVTRNDISYGTYLYHMPVINLLLHADTPNPALAVVHL